VALEIERRADLSNREISRARHAGPNRLA